MELRDDIKKIITCIADYCCENALSILSLHYIKNKLVRNKFNILIQYILEHDLDNNIDPSIFPPGYCRALELIQKEIEKKSYELLINKKLYLDNIKAFSSDLAKFTIADKEDGGLINVSDLEKLDFYSNRKSNLFLDLAIPGSFNSSLWLENELASLEDKSKLKIRLNSFRLSKLRDEELYFEKARSFGKPFNKKWLESLKGVETAQHDPSDDPLDRSNTTQFIWERIKGKNEIQFSCEEIPNYGNFDKIEHYNATRFLHGIYSISQESFTHLDGAIHIFTNDNYTKRMQLHLKDHFNFYDKAKIFRIDSPIHIEEGQRFMVAFFRGNNLISEYFTRSYP